MNTTSIIPVMIHRGFTVKAEPQPENATPFTVYDPAGVKIHTQDEETIEEVRETIDYYIDDRTDGNNWHTREDCMTAAQFTERVLCGHQLI